MLLLLMLLLHLGRCCWCGSGSGSDCALSFCGCDNGVVVVVIALVVGLVQTTVVVFGVWILPWWWLWYCGCHGLGFHWGAVLNEEDLGVLWAWDGRERELEPRGLRESVHEALDGHEEAMELGAGGGLALDGLGDEVDRGVHMGNDVGLLEKIWVGQG